MKRISIISKLDGGAPGAVTDLSCTRSVSQPLNG